MTPALRVGLLTYNVVGWVAIVLSLAGGIAAYFARQYGASVGLASLTLLGVLVLCSAGSISISENGLGHNNGFGRFWMDWDKVRRIEVGTYGTLVLYGDDRRFVLQPPNYWSGPDRNAAIALLNTKLGSLAMPAAFNRTADYRIHRNVRTGSGPRDVRSNNRWRGP